MLCVDAVCWEGQFFANAPVNTFLEGFQFDQLTIFGMVAVLYDQGLAWSLGRS
jgi:hypothetical protein